MLITMLFSRSLLPGHQCLHIPFETVQFSILVDVRLKIDLSQGSHA